VSNSCLTSVSWPCAGFANEGQLLLVNAASLAELHRRLPPQRAAEQPAAAADAQQHGSAADHCSKGGALATGRQNGGSRGAVPTGTAAAIESDFSEASAVLHTPPQEAAAQPSAHPAAGSPAHVARFRPNLLIEGPAAFAEDGWRSVRIGGTSFNVTGVRVLPCTPNSDARM
jgi:MOSC domain